FASSFQRFQTLKGDQLPQSPENKIALNGAYTFEFTPGSLTVSATYFWQDSQRSSVFNGTDYVVPSYAVTDFRAVWNDAKARYTVIAFVKNAFDVTGYTTTGVSGPTALYGPVADDALGMVINPVTHAVSNNTLQRVGYNMSHGLIFPRTFGIELQ